MHSNIRRSGKHQETFFRINAFECFSGCSCHVITKKIMHFVVADFLTIYIVIESFVILRTVNNIFHLCLHCPRMDLAFGVFCKFSGEFFCLCKSLRRIKDCRFIHIVPESLDSLVDQETVLISEPFPGFRIQHIRKMGISRPYSCNKITSVFSFTEVVIFYTFLVNLVAFFHLDTGINDRDQAKLLVFHFLYKFREIRKVFFIDCEVFKVLHIINIHVDHVNRDMILAISFCHCTEVFFCCITPAALSKTESELRRNVAAADHTTELFYDVVSIFSFDDIDIQICIFAGYLECVHSGISNIKGQF